MSEIKRLIELIKNGDLDNRLEDIYVDNSVLDYQRNRYINAIEKYENIYFDKSTEECMEIKDVHLFSAPGRTEIGGNHTDHQRGEVLAAAVNVDVLAVVSKNDEGIIKLVSDDYEHLCNYPLSGVTGSFNNALIRLHNFDNDIRKKELIEIETYRFLNKYGYDNMENA